MATKEGTQGPGPKGGLDSAHPSETARDRKRGRKRGHGEGSISQHKTGGWRGRVMVGRLPDGRPDVREVYGKTRGECQKKLDQVRRRAADGLLGDAQAERGTMAAYVDRWLEAKKCTVRERTHDRYTALMKKHVKPTSLGRSKLGAVKPDQLQRLYAEKLAEGLAPRTVHHIHTVLHNALEQAVRWGYVARNVADAVTPPSVPVKEVRWPSGEEVDGLLTAALREGDRLAALWILAAHTGMRQGELLGLTWDDVDLDAGVLHVHRILVRVKGQVPTYGEPKTKRSRRAVPLTPDAVDALRAHADRQDFERRRLGEDYGRHGLVFATVTGTPLAVSVVQAAYKRALSRADLPASIRFHDLRHAAASMMLGSGVDVPTVAKVLGHARNSTTLDVYGHAIPSNHSSAVAAIQRAIRGTRAVHPVVTA